MQRKWEFSSIFHQVIITPSLLPFFAINPYFLE